ARDHRAECAIPRDRQEASILLEQRRARAAFGVEGVMFREPFRAEHAAIDWMGGVAADADRSPVTDADEHAAAHRAVPARGGDPRFGGALPRGVAGDRVDGIRVTIGVGVETEQARDAHAASLPTSRYGAAMWVGTTLVKNR